MMNKTTGSLFLAMVYFHGLESSYAFQIHRNWATSALKSFAETDPFRAIDIDLNVAEDCATHFGKYSVEEIEYCRDELHARRVQHVAFGEDVSTPDVMKERFLEDELTVQMNKLKSKMPGSYLFPDEERFDSDIDTNMGIDSLLMDDGVVVDAKPSSENVPTNKQNVVWEELIKEGALESVVICIFLGLVMFAPNII